MDPKIVFIIEALYNDMECAVVIDGYLTKWFSVNVGFGQRRLLSTTLINIFLEFIITMLKDLDDNLFL